MKKNFPPALVVIELPDYQKRRSRLDLPLFSLTLVFILLITYGVFGDLLRSRAASDRAVLSRGIEIISENNTG